MASGSEPPAKRLRTGGQLQRLKRASHEEAQPRVRSRLAEKLLESWAWGEKSPQEVQELAAASCRDWADAQVEPPTKLQALAKLGSSGLYANKMHREILAIADEGCLFSPAFTTQVQFKDEWGLQLQSMLLPHMIFADLYHRYPVAFRRYMLPDPNLLGEFWQRQKGHQGYAGHPIVDRPDFESDKMIPLACHGDGTPVIGIGKIWSRMLTSWSWSSIMCQSGWTKDAQLPIWFLFDETDNDSSEQFLQILAWSFKALQEGTWPSRDHRGKLILGKHLHIVLGPEQFPVVWQVFWVAHNIFLLSGMFLVAEQFCAFWQFFSWHVVFSTMFQPRYSKGSTEAKLANTALAAGYKGICWSLVGDMEYLRQRLHLPHFMLKKGPCALCKCTGDDSETSWKDCRPQAAWTTLQWTRHEFLGFSQIFLRLV